MGFIFVSGWILFVLGILGNEWRLTITGLVLFTVYYSKANKPTPPVCETNYDYTIELSPANNILIIDKHDNSRTISLDSLEEYIVTDNI
jgi:hypothetical protein